MTNEEKGKEKEMIGAKPKWTELEIKGNRGKLLQFLISWDYS